MADMISSEEAKALLNCDDATLSNYVSNGTIRAQRADGSLKLFAEDVHNLAGAIASDSDDGTIVLEADSEDLSIDLGEVIDSDAVTMTHSAEDSADNITFGEELEVVNFDDDDGSDTLQLDDGSDTGALSFTEQNTAIITDIDETAINATTTNDFQVIDHEEEAEEERTSVSSLRRSVRSSERRAAVNQTVKTHPAWTATLILSAAILLFFVAPFIALELSGRNEDEKLDYGAATFLYRGTTDNIFTGMASAVAGFSVEPDKAKFAAINGNAGDWVSINAVAPGHDVWRTEQYMSKKPSEIKQADRENHLKRYTITSIETNDKGVPLKASSESETFDVLPVIDINNADATSSDSVYRPAFKK